MKSYSIYHRKNIHWNLFAEEVLGFCDGVAPQVAQVLSAVHRVFVDTFGSDIVNSRPVLSVLYSDDGPMTFRENGLIFLSSRGAFHQQHIYQFSHELCHFIIPGAVCADYRWLEESLCEMMSWFVLQRFFDSRDSNPIPAYSVLYESTPTYILNCKKKRIDLKGEPLPAFLEATMPALRKNCYMRNVNAAVAFSLYPLFEENPQLWKIVPELHRITENTSLSETISFLCDTIDAPAELCARLTSLLCQ